VLPLEQQPFRLDPAQARDREIPEGHVEDVEAVNNAEDPSAGMRTVPFSRELSIERDDFMEDPPSS
jgi:glutaminyl-tRNA synthetase